EGGSVPGAVAEGLSSASADCTSLGRLTVPIPSDGTKRLVWLTLGRSRQRLPSLRARCSANDAKATAFSGQCECFAPFEPLSLITPDASRDSRRYRRKAFAAAAPGTDPPL